MVRVDNTPSAGAKAFHERLGKYGVIRTCSLLTALAHSSISSRGRI